nr:hsp90 protein homolog - quail (fragments) [Phasianidae sp.]
KHVYYITGETKKFYEQFSK